MSRVGKNPVPVPSGVTVAIAGQQISVKGKLGEDKRLFSKLVKVESKDGKVTVSMLGNSKQAKMDWGTTRAHIKNMMVGVTEGYGKTLLIEGVGNRAEMKGNDLYAKVGHSHEDIERGSPGIKVTVDKQTTIKVIGHNKEAVGHKAAIIRKFKKPEPYKGKGIRYEGEYVERKEGKKK
ncbi:MAG: 50S ribosomal protein L6 [Dongiaceae bacterium]